MVTMRIGSGLDAHRFGGDGPVMVGTLAVPHPHGLVGHSDGDVAAHAICDALLAAAGEPDIGALFPPGDPAWAGVAGRTLLEIVRDRIAERGWSITNVHAVIVCEEPRISPHREAMQHAMSEILGAPVTVHATTTESMGFTGRKEGIFCQATALIFRTP